MLILALALLIQTPAALPEWARENPFGYERAQCSPMIRGDEPLEACQARVRSLLLAELGDDLPPALRPAAVEDCRPADAGGGVVCGPQRRAARSDGPVLVEQDCSNRVTSEGFSSDCRPVGQSEERGVSITLFGGDDD
ncbi:hypothetical protein [Brevundimonas balnearis]|uniref:Uncharacterized protein n=1 Tax=Brevundimonas balnearis TaxID=1572858 RepID=A0ABV6R7M9_9CAUL